MPLLLTKYFVGVDFYHGTGFSLLFTPKNGPSYQNFDTMVAKFCKCTVFTILCFLDLPKNEFWRDTSYNASILFDTMTLLSRI